MTAELIQRTRALLIAEAQAVIDATLSGQDRPNNPEKWIAYWQRHIDDVREGRADKTFFFRQQAHYLDTGECVPFLAGA
jgi:hypothetical protein